MSELNFPKNPAVGQECTFNSLLYMFDGVRGRVHQDRNGTPRNTTQNTVNGQYGSGTIQCGCN